MNYKLVKYLGLCFVILLLITPSLAAPACSFCEFINISKGDPGPQGIPGEANMTAGPMGPAGIMNQTPNMTPGTPGATGPMGPMNQTPNMTSAFVGSTWYNHNMISPDIDGYLIFNRTLPYDGEGVATATTLVAGVEYPIEEFATNIGDPGLTILPSGERIWYTNAKVDSLAGGDSYIVVRFYKRDIFGNEVELYNLTTAPLSLTTEEIMTTKITPYNIAMNTSDRFVAKYFAKSDASSNKIVTLYYDGTAHVSRATSPINQGIAGPAGPVGPMGPQGPAGATGGVGGSVLFFNHSIVSDIAGYEGLQVLPSGSTESDESVTVKNTLGEVLIDPYITLAGQPGIASLPAGLWQFRSYHYVDTASGTSTAVFKVYNRTVGGTETLLFTATSEDINSLTASQYITSYVQTTSYPIALTDRVVVKVYGQSTHSSNVIFHFVYQGSVHNSNIQTPLAISDASTLTFSVIAGENIKKGQAVYISGSSTSDPIVSLANNTNTAKSRVVGVMVADTSANSIGQVRRNGILTEVDTRSTNTFLNPNSETWVASDLLFATTNGGLTKNRPTSGRSVKVAYSSLGSNEHDVLLAYPMENPVWTTAAYNEGIVLRLGDNNGATNISIRDYANNQVAYIDSGGNTNLRSNGINESYAYLPGRLGGQTLTGGTTTGNLTLNGSSNNGNVIIQPNGGKVIIGNTTSLGYQFEVRNNVNANIIASVGDTHGGFDVTANSVRLNAVSNTNLSLFTHNIERLRILNDGNVGIGTSNPQGILEITNPSSSSTTIYLNEDDIGNSAQFLLQRNKVNKWLFGAVNGTTAPSIDGFRIISMDTPARIYFYADQTNGYIGLGGNTPTSTVDNFGTQRIRSLGAGTVTSDAGGNLTAISDEKMKTDIKSYTLGINAIKKIIPIDYKYNIDSKLDTVNTYTGFSAQNLETAIPSSVYTKQDVKYDQKMTKHKNNTEDDEYETIEVPIEGSYTKSISDRAIIATLVNAVKEQQLIIENQTNQIDNLITRVETLEKK